MPKNKKSTTVVKSGGMFSGTAKHRRTTVVSMSKSEDVTAKVKRRAPSIPRNRKAAPGARKVKYEPTIDSDKSEEEEEDDDIPTCCIGGRGPGRICGKLEDWKTNTKIISDVSIKCCQCEERKCPDCEWSVQCPTCDEHGFCPDCEDNAELCPDCGSCIECRPDGNYCCKSYLFKNEDRDSDDDSCYRWLNGKRRIR